MTTLRVQPKVRVQFACPFKSTGCKFKLYPTHEEHLWVSKNVMGRHLAQMHREQMETALKQIKTRKNRELRTHREYDLHLGFRRGL